MTKMINLKQSFFFFQEKDAIAGSTSAPNPSSNLPPNFKIAGVPDDKHSSPAKDKGYVGFAKAWQSVGDRLKKRSDKFEEERDRNMENISLEILKPTSPVVGGSGASYPDLIDVDITMNAARRSPRYENVNENNKKNGGGALESLDSGITDETVQQDPVSTSLFPSAPSHSLFGSPNFNSTAAVQPNSTHLAEESSVFNGFDTLPSIQVFLFCMAK